MILISCDWGSSSFRLRAVNEDTGHVLAERRSALGSSTLLPPGTPPTVRAAEFARRLQEEVTGLDPGGAWTDSPVLVSGMATSAHGWRELPYAQAPVPLDGRGLVTARQTLPGGRRAILISGITDGHDVMRGEECELLGLTRWSGWATAAPDATATVILPGTHCKHVQVAAGQIRRFRTFMTGELYGLLRQHSVLRHSLPPVTDPPPSATDLTAVREGALCGREAGLSAALFQVRTGTLLRGLSPAAAEAFLNGVLIGAEFAVTPSAAGAMVLSAGVRGSALYAEVLRALGVADRLTLVPPDVSARLSAAGHAVVWQSLTAGYPGPADQAQAKETP